MTKGGKGKFLLALVGAGIHGIHLATSALEQGLLPPEGLLIIDRYPENLFLWKRRVRNCCMDYLRSPASHGLDPRFPALRRTMRKPSDWTNPYHRPSVPLFHRHAEDRLARFLCGVSRITGEVTAVERNTPPPGRSFRILLGSGESCGADAVILAPGMSPPHIPPPFRDLYGERTGGRVLHVHDPQFDPGAIGTKERVLLVGGGIAALHLLSALAERGSRPVLWRRDAITEYQFDSDPCFIGPRCSSLIRSAEDERERLELIRRNRRPGSVPPDLLQRFHKDLKMDLYCERELEVVSAEMTGAGLRIRGARPRSSAHRGEIARFDRVVLCTGFLDEPPARELVKATAAACSAPLAAGGYPRTDDDLSWVPGLYVSGGLADLAIGPPARNIIGAHLARRRIFPSLRRLIR